MKRLLAGFQPGSVVLNELNYRGPFDERGTDMRKENIEYGVESGNRCVIPTLPEISSAPRI